MNVGVDIGTFKAPAPGHSPRGVYLANQWYGHQDTLLHYMDLPTDTPLPGKIEIGWQPGTGLDGEQGMRLEIAHYRLPFYVWGRRQIEACRAAGLGWGHAIGAPILYHPSWCLAMQSAACVSNIALGMPSHSSSPYWIESGWTGWARGFRLWAESEGLQPLACLHPNDFVRAASAAVAAEDVPTTCVGGVMWPGYLDRLLSLILGAHTIVTDRVCTPTFYGAALGRRVIVRGTPLVPSLPPDEWSGVEVDHEALAREFPWTVTGVDGRDAALVQLGADCVHSPADLRAAVFGQTPTADWWRNDPAAVAYAENPTVNDRRGRSAVLRQMLDPIAGRISSALEIGCGRGANLNALLDALPGVCVSGIEPGHRARELARVAGYAVVDGALPRIDSDDSVADLVMTAGVLIHVDPRWRTSCVAEMVRLARRYLLLVEYGADAPSWNGHLGKDDFGAMLRACGCAVIAADLVPEGSALGTHYWLADVGNKVMPI